MRTDSVNLSSLCINACKEEIEATWGEKYHKTRQYHTHSKGAQEAHEAIRPTYMNAKTVEGTAQERRLYELIWKRTAACQMEDAQRTEFFYNDGNSVHPNNKGHMIMAMKIADFIKRNF